MAVLVRVKEIKRQGISYLRELGVFLKPLKIFFFIN